MSKFGCFAVLCFAVVLTVTRQTDKLSHLNKNIPLHWSKSRDSVDICSNNTKAQAYLTQILDLINDLQANASYNAVLQLQLANFVSYLKNATNQALLTSNCIAFVTGLQAAKSADKTAERLRSYLVSKIGLQIRKIERNVFGGKRFLETDSDEKLEHHYRML